MCVLISECLNVGFPANLEDRVSKLLPNYIPFCWGRLQNKFYFVASSLGLKASDLQASKDFDCYSHKV